MSHITVRVGKLPGTINAYAIEGNKVSDALNAAGLSADGFEVRINGSVGDLNTQIGEGATILLVTKIKGNAGDHITVRVGKLPGMINEIALNGARTVADALGAAGLSDEGFEIRVNGSVVAPTQVLAQNDTVLLVTKIKGNAGDHITVRVGKLPGMINEIALNGARAVSDALGAAGLSSDGFEIRVNGSVVDESQTLRQGDTVLLVTKIKGNVSK